MKQILLLAPLLVAAFSGCAGKDVPGSGLAADASASEAVPSQVPPAGFERPNWTVGQWWDVHVAVDFGFGFLQDIDGKLVVSQKTETGYRLGSDVENVSIFDSYFDSFYVGGFDRDLNPQIAGQTAQFYKWPLTPGQSWTTQFLAQGFDSFSGRIDNATFKVSEIPDDESAYAPRLRIQGTTDHKDLIDFDYSPKTGWMTYFQMTNETTGRLVLRVQFKAHGLGFAGTVHELSIKTLYARFAMLPPFGENLVDPTVAPVPPTDRVTVPTGFSFVEEIKGAFTFPIEAAGGGEVAVIITRADGTVDPFFHTGASQEGDGKFERIQARGTTAGDWTVSFAIAATGGAFVGLFGFTDSTTTL